MNIQTSIAADGLQRLVTHDQIEDAVSRLAAELDGDYAERRPLFIGILRGSFIFFADLVRRMQTPVEIEFLRLSSYGSGTTSSGKPRVVAGLPREAAAGRDIVIVEDIVDTGLTTQAAIRYLKRHRAASVTVCAFLDKPERRRVNVEAAYVGVTIPDKFVVGYGLDMDAKYRQLPEVYAVE